MNEPLRELLARCKAGEDDAIRELVRRFQPWALDFAAAILDDRDLAEDAVQEGFLAALQRLDDLREPEAFPGWMRQIVRTQALRITRARREAELPEGTEAVDCSSSPSESAERDELRRKVREAIGSLPPASREATQLFYLDERSCAEVAEVLRIPTGTVKRRLHDARKQLHSMLLGYVEDTVLSPNEKPSRDKGMPL